MLSKFRKGADSLVVRILLGLIALSFVGIGGVSFLKGNSQGEIVSFSRAEPILIEQLLFAKAREIEMIQAENNINLSEEELAELNIEQTVLQKLITAAMVKYLANYYDFTISEEKIISLVKNMPYFKNSHGEFDVNLFNSAFHNSKTRQEKYLENIKEGIIANTIYNIFINSFTPPKMMIKNIINHMAETRIVDIVSINADHKVKNYTLPAFSPEEIQKYYDNHQSKFMIPELRTFSYIKVDKKFIEKNIQITEEKIKSYYEENKEEYSGKTYPEVKPVIAALLGADKAEELMIELIKNLEEDVAAGLSLTDIARKYEFKINNIDRASFESLIAGTASSSLAQETPKGGQKGEQKGGQKGSAENIETKSEQITEQINEQPIEGIGEIAENIFEMTEGELSYPIESATQNMVVIAELKTITPPRTRTYEEVVNDIELILAKKALVEANRKILTEIQQEYQEKQQFPAKSLIAMGIEISPNKVLTRAELVAENKLPFDLLDNIFKADIPAVTPLVQEGNKIYFAYIKSADINNTKVKKIIDTQGDNINTMIKEILWHELITWLSEENNMQLHLERLAPVNQE